MPSFYPGLGQFKLKSVSKKDVAHYFNLLYFLNLNMALKKAGGLD